MKGWSGVCTAPFLMSCNDPTKERLLSNSGDFNDFFTHDSWRDDLVPEANAELNIYLCWKPKTWISQFSCLQDEIEVAMLLLGGHCWGDVRNNQQPDRNRVNWSYTSGRDIFRSNSWLIIVDLNCSQQFVFTYRKNILAVPSIFFLTNKIFVVSSYCNGPIKSSKSRNHLDTLYNQSVGSVYINCMFNVCKIYSSWLRWLRSKFCTMVWVCKISCFLRNISNSKSKLFIVSEFTTDRVVVMLL